MKIIRMYLYNHYTIRTCKKKDRRLLPGLMIILRRKNFKKIALMVLTIGYQYDII